MPQYTLDDLLGAIVSRESGGNPRVKTSVDGAVGIAQVMPDTFRRFAKPGERIDNPQHNLAVARRYLAYLGEKTNWNAHKMAQGYIAGEGGIGKNRRDSLGTSTQDYANQVIGRLQRRAQPIEARNAAAPPTGQLLPPRQPVPPTPVQPASLPVQEAAVPEEAPITFDDEPPITFDEPPPTAGATPQTDWGQSIYTNSEPALATLGGIAGAMLGTPAGPLGAVAGGALGTTAALGARRAVGGMLGYEQPLAPADLAMQTAQDLQQGAIAEAGGQILAVPVNAALRALPRAGDGIRSLLGGRQTTPDAMAAGADVITTGIPLSAAQRSGSRLAGGVERTLESMPGSGGVYAPFREEQVAASSRALDDVVTRLGNPAETQAGLGARVAGTFDRLVDDAVTARTAQGAVDFQFLDHAARGIPFVPLTTFRQTLQNELERLPEIGAHAADRARRTELERIIADIDTRGGRASGRDINGLLSGYSRAMYGGNSIFANIAPDAADRALAGRLYRSIDHDLDAVANSTTNSVAAQAIQTARTNWRMHSEGLQLARDTVIGRALGTNTRPSPEALYQRIANMKPSELRQTTAILDSVDPVVMADVRAQYLQGLVERASTTVNAPTAASGATTGITPNNFVKLMAKEQDRLEAMIPNQHTRDRLNAVTRQLARMSATSKPSGFIKNASLAGGAIVGFEFVARNLLYGNIAPALAGSAAIGGAYISSRTVARALLNQDGLRAMQVLTNPQSSGRAAVNAWNTLLNYSQSNDEAATPTQRPAMPQTPLMPSNYMVGDNGNG